MLASCWFGVWLVFWSICRTKLPHYLLPAYPALALLTACFVDRWQSTPANIGGWALRNAWISLILVGVGMMIALPIVTSIYLPGEEVLGLLGLIPLLGGGWCWWQTAHGRHQQAAIGAGRHCGCLSDGRLRMGQLAGRPAPERQTDDCHDPCG